MVNQYFDKIIELLSVLKEQEKENLQIAAQKIAECIQLDGIIHVFGCGHSHMLAEEVFYRSGGLVPINPILIEDLMLHKGAVRSSKIERQNDFADKFMTHTDIKAKDVVIVVSNSGRNPVPVDVAQYAKDKGSFVIGITSSAYANSQPSRHSQGHYLLDIVDLVIDNHIEVGDALIHHQNSGVSYGSGSTVIGTTIINNIIVEAVNIMIENDSNPPLFKSGNIDGTDEHNKQLIKRYKDRIPLLEK